MIELTFLKAFLLIRLAIQKSMILFTIGIFLNKRFKFQPNVCNGCHDLLMMSMNLILLIKTLKMLITDHCIISRISK